MARVDYTTIETIFSVLEAQYSSTISSSDQTLPIAYSKLAVLELGGWIEVSVDTILFNYIDNKILDADCRRIAKNVINRNYSFEYNHLSHIFICALGVNNWENIVDHVGGADMSILLSVCNSYKSSRDNAAHTYQLDAATSSFIAPSQVLNDYRRIKPVVDKIEQEVLSLI